MAKNADPYSGVDFRGLGLSLALQTSSLVMTFSIFAIQLPSNQASTGTFHHLLQRFCLLP